MLVLGIETSCDETAAAVVADGSIIRSNIIASQVQTHAPYGGVVPEIASREHLDTVNSVVDSALTAAGASLSDIDGVAVTRGPGLIGSLLVGISYAKSLAFVGKMPIVAVNHIEGHIYSVVFENPPIEYPAMALIVSGGHTTLFLVPEPRQYAVLGRTRDDAAGEAYDKVGKLLGLGYPGGPILDRLSRLGDPGAAQLVFTIPRIDSAALDFSFSGLKTAVLRYVKERQLVPINPGEQPTQAVCDIAASFQEKVVQSLMARLREGVRRHQPRTVILAGGVACNSALRAASASEDFDAPVYYPSPVLTTDNAAMIAAAGSPRLARGDNDGLEFSASASLKLENIVLAGYERPARARYRL
jgi:N6-L-threonylcarbamoyladenine synthase